MKARRTAKMTLIPRIAGSIAAAMLLAASPVVASAQSFSPDQQHQIEDIVKNYLIAHPEVIQEAQDALDKRQQEAQAAKAQTAIKTDSATLFNSPHQVVLGNPNGKVTMVEFFDYNCPHCKDAVSDMVRLLNTDHDLRFVLKEFPILAQGSVDAAHVAVAVRMQDPTGAKYLAFHEKLFSTRGMVDQARALEVAKEVGCDMSRISKDMNSPEVQTTIDQDMKLADAIGVDGTPSYVIGDHLIVGAIGYDKLQQQVAALQK
jgi:protein-disulfide isomerase